MLTEHKSRAAEHVNNTSHGCTGNSMCTQCTVQPRPRKYLIMINKTWIIKGILQTNVICAV